MLCRQLAAESGAGGADGSPHGTPGDADRVERMLLCKKVHCLSGQKSLSVLPGEECELHCVLQAVCCGIRRWRCLRQPSWHLRKCCRRWRLRPWSATCLRPVWARWALTQPAWHHSLFQVVMSPASALILHSWLLPIGYGRGPFHLHLCFGRWLYQVKALSRRMWQAAWRSRHVEQSGGACAASEQARNWGAECCPDEFGAGSTVSCSEG